MQRSSCFGRSLATNVATAAVNVSQTTTNLGSQTRQIRVVSNLGIWLMVGSTTATAQTDNYMPPNLTEFVTVTPGQVVSFISTSTSTGWVGITEMT
jgi:hypothetical protein